MTDLADAKRFRLDLTRLAEEIGLPVVPVVATSGEGLDALRLAVDGVFDTERTFNGKLFKLDAHLERLGRSLKMLRIDLGMSLDELGRCAEETVERNLHRLEHDGDWWVTQTIHRGDGGTLKLHYTSLEQLDDVLHRLSLGGR